MTDKEFQAKFKSATNGNKNPKVKDLVMFLKNNLGNDCCLNIFVNNYYEYVATNLNKNGIEMYVNRRLIKCIYYHNATIDNRPIIEVYTVTKNGY